jgi:hypothetical protein
MFDLYKSDSQATNVDAVKVNDFTSEVYREYEQKLLERFTRFINSDSGALV